MNRVRVERKRRVLSLLMAAVLLVTLVPGQVLAAAVGRSGDEEADIRIYWEAEKTALSLDETAQLTLRADLSQRAAASLSQVTITLTDLTEEEQQALGASLDGFAETGNGYAVSFPVEAGGVFSLPLTVQAPEGVSAFDFAIGQEQIAVTYQGQSGGEDIPIQPENDDAGEAADPAEGGETPGQPLDPAGDSDTDAPAGEKAPTQMGENGAPSGETVDEEAEVPAESAQTGEADSSLPTEQEAETTGGQLEGQLVLNDDPPVEALTVVIEGIALSFREASQPTGEIAFALTLSTTPTSLVPAARKLSDFTVTAALTATAPAGWETENTPVLLTVTLPDKLSFPEETLSWTETQVRSGDHVLAEITAMPEQGEIQNAYYAGNTLYIQILQSWADVSEGDETAPEGSEGGGLLENAQSLLEAAGKAAAQALGRAAEYSWTYPVTIHGSLLTMADDFRTGEILVGGQIPGTEPPVTAQAAAISIAEETAAVPEGLVVTAERDPLIQNIFWVDNHDESAIRPDGDFFRETELYFSLDGGAWELLTPVNMASLGLSQMPEPDVRETEGAYTLTYTGLPAAAAQYDPNVEAEEPLETHQIQWRLGGQPQAAGYDAVSVTEDNWGEYLSAAALGWYYVLETDVTFDVQARWGGWGTADDLRDLVLHNFSLYVSGLGEDAEQAYPLAELEAAGDLTVDAGEPSGQAGPASLAVTVSGGWKYDLDGSPVVYTAAQSAGEDGRLELPTLGEDYFQVTYDNSAVSNASADTQAAHSGGRIVLTLTGRTGYSAQKVWLDDGDAVRPSGELHLWRYRAGESYTTAAPVRDQAGNPYILNLTGEDQTIQFTYQGQAAQLEKYDPEGYPYVYVVREYLDATAVDGSQADSYEQVFGAVGEDGTVADTLPSDTRREEGNRFLYDGGTLSNRISDTVTVEVSKTWEASAYQSQLGNVAVEFTLQSRPAGVYTGEEQSQLGWEDTGVTARQEDLTEERLDFWRDSRTASAYDAQGRRLEFRWVESAVYQGDSTENLLDRDTGCFTLLQDGQLVEYRSETVRELDGTTRITNSLADTVDYEVVKVWADVPEAGVTFRLYRLISGSPLEGSVQTPYLTFTWSGTNVTQGEIWPEGDGVELRNPAEVNPFDEAYGGRRTWTTWLEGLPEFTEDGRAYEYLLLEDTASREFFPTYETLRDPDGTYHTVVTNAPGEGNRILVRKEWIDDSDSAHRGDVTICVYPRAEAAAERGDDPDRPITTLTLGSGVWTALAYTGDYTAQEVYILETSVTSASGETDLHAVPLQPYQFTGEEAPSYVPLEPVYEAADVYQYQTRYHRYEAVYSAPFSLAGETIFTVTDRRLGQVDLTVTKTWDDGGGTLRRALQDALARLDEADRITPCLQLTFAGGSLAAGNGYAITTDGLSSGSGDTVFLGGGEVPILDETGMPAPSRQSIDLNQREQTFYFHDLPKYDATGAVVHYGVEEVWLDVDGQPIAGSLSDYFENHLTHDSALDQLLELLEEYRCTVGQGTYTAAPEGEALRDDTQTIPVTNGLNGVKTVYWHKQWNDNYTQENNQRPDIYLDIYRISVDPAAARAELFRADYRWQYSGDEEETVPGETGLDPWRHWHAVLSDVPKYDENGYPYLYFAVEHTSVNAADFDYQTVEYQAPQNGGFISIGNAQAVDEAYLGTGEGGWAIPVPARAGLIYPRYALREGGTFVNNLSDTITVQGQKLWTGLPDSYPDTQLPAVTFALDRTWTESGVTQKEEAVATLTVTDWASVHRSGTYLFRMQYEGENIMAVSGGEITVTPADPAAEQLPRYNENGSLYTYALRETGIRWTDAVEDANGGQGPESDDVFDIVDPATNSYVARNAYTGTPVSFSVKKLLQLDSQLLGLEGETLEQASFPAVQLRLTRTYTLNGGGASAPETVATQWWTAQQVKSAYRAALAGGETDPGSAGSPLEHLFTFEDIPLYAPNGARYIYTVTEVTDGFLEGYTASWGPGELESGDSRLTPGHAATPFYPEPPQEEVPGEGTIPAILATFQNVPDTSTLRLTGAKTWNDFGDIFGLRPAIGADGQPEGLTLELYRSADAQQGQNNSIPQQKVDPEKYTVRWTVPQEGNQWTYAITGTEDGELEAYAPNGMPWKYTVREVLTGDLAQLYTASPTSVGENGGREEDPDSPGNFVNDMRPLTNSMAATVRYAKAWQDQDGHAITGDYIGLELMVGFQLEVRETGPDGAPATDWEAAEPYFRRELESLTDADWNAIFQNVTFAPVLTGRIGNGTWSGTIQNLPRAIQKDGELNPTYLQYRVVETSVTADGQTQPIAIQQDGATYQVGEGLVQEAAFTASGNVTTNVLSLESLTLSKTWAGDSSNFYGTRPASSNPNYDWETDFVIQRREGNAWVNVQVYSASYPDGRDLVVPVYGQDGDETVSTVISGLLAGQTYRARELQPGWNRLPDNRTVDPADILTSDGGYNGGAYQAHYTASTSVTNSMEGEDLSTEMAAQKNWVPEVPQGAQVVLALQYRDQNNRWTTLREVTLDGVTDETQSPVREDAPWHAVWEDLPLYHPNGWNQDSAGTPAPTDYRVTERLSDESGFLPLGEPNLSGNTYTFTNVPATELTVVKTWVGTDEANRQAVVAGLYRSTEGAPAEQVLENGTWRTVTLDSGNDWKGTFVNLPSCNAEGQPYTYFAREVSVGGVPVDDSFDVEYHDEAGLTHMVNYGGDHQADYVRVIGTKTWVDQEDTTRGQILLHLSRTTTPEVESSWELVPETEYYLRWTETGADTWSYSFDGLPRYDGEGTPYAYRVTEMPPEGYDSFAAPGISLLESGLFVYDFTNVQRGNLSVEKQVTGSGDPNKEFTFTITLTGTSDTGLTPETVSGVYGDLTFQAGTATFTLRHGERKTAQGLPAGFTYTVTEAMEAGYTTTSAGETGEIPAGGTVAATFTNYRPTSGGGDESTSLTVRKVWRLDDGGTVPASVTVHLLRGNTVADIVTLDDDNSWTHTWTGLSQRYTWTVEEADVPAGFTAAVTRSGMTFTITNDDTGEEPEDPQQPEDPEDPGEPHDPGQPGEPDEPGQPGSPDEPGEPTEPTNPDQPAEPANPDVPRTGDTTQNGLLALLCLISLAGMAALGFVEIQKRFRGKDRQ